MIDPATSAAIECHLPFVVNQIKNKPATQNQESPECAKNAAALRKNLFLGEVSSRAERRWSSSNKVSIIVANSGNYFCRTNYNFYKMKKGHLLQQKKM